MIQKYLMIIVSSCVALSVQAQSIDSLSQVDLLNMYKGRWYSTVHVGTDSLSSKPALVMENEANLLTRRG
ncbi:MAG: hypothetical protein OCD76_23610 [Reichenbachiella sp.]